MLTGIIIIAAVGLLSILSHRRSRLENKIYKNVPLNDWLTVLVFPVLFYLGWFFMVKNILFRAKVDILPFGDFDVLAITILFGIYGFVGVAIHFTGKILWRYLREERRTMAYKVNEMFHGKLSHYLVYLSLAFIGFLIPMLEINHPLLLPLTNFYVFLIIIAGTVFGMSGIRAVFYTNEWFGGYNKPIFFIFSILLLILVALFRNLGLRLDVYPVSLFIITIFTSGVLTFLARQFFIFSRLGNRRKLRFIAKILSA